MANRLNVLSSAMKLSITVFLTCAMPLMAVGCNAQPAIDAAHCQKNFLSKNGTWLAHAFDEKELAHAQDQFRDFTPIEKIFVNNGRLYIQTWATEPVAASISATDTEIKITPQYMDWLGTSDAIGLEAKKVSPYAGKDVAHILLIGGNCVDPKKLEVSVHAPGRKTHRVLLFKTRNEAAEFEDPAFP